MSNIMAMRWCRLYKGTAAELSIEDAIASLGVPYRPQFPGFLYGLRYYLDFYLPTLKLVIEVDDPSHDKKVEEDEERTRRIGEEWGATVVRTPNEKALNDPFGAVKGCLVEAGLWSADFASRLRQASTTTTSLPRMAEALPEPRRAPRKEKRAAKAEGRHRRRKANRHSVRPRKTAQAKLATSPPSPN